MFGYSPFLDIKLTTVLESALKSFLVRLFQVIWIAGFLIILGIIFANISFYGELSSAIFGAFAWLVFFAVIQYLIFSNLDPRALFDGTLMPDSKNSINRGLFSILVGVGLSLSILSGIAAKFYHSYQYNQKIEAGNDIEFYSEILESISYSYEPTDCYMEDENPPKKEDLQRTAMSIEKQGISGLNILVTISRRNDSIGNALRCEIRDDVGIENIAAIADIKY